MSAQQIKLNIHTLVNSIEDESVLVHDLSLVFLANELFKGSESIPIEGAIAFKKALLKSATKVPILTNRL